MTDKQKKFCEEYLIDLNAKQAAIRAGFSKNTAEQAGSRLLRNVKVKEYIARRQKKSQERNTIRADDVLNALKTIGFAEIEPERIRVSDKLKALEIISKMLGIGEYKPNYDKLDEILSRIEGNI